MQQSPLPPLRPDATSSPRRWNYMTEQGVCGETGRPAAPAAAAGDHACAAMAPQRSARGMRIRPAASDVVRELIIGSGVPSRGHRRYIFHPALAAAGVNCGPHKEYVHVRNRLCRRARPIDTGGKPSWPRSDEPRALLPPADGALSHTHQDQRGRAGDTASEDSSR